MALIVNDIHLPPDTDKREAVEQAIKILKISKSKIKDSYIAKTSVDARRRGHICLVYSVRVELSEESMETRVLERLQNPKVLLRRMEPHEVRVGTEKMGHRPIIVGFGPAGMFAGLFLARMGYRPLILERGESVDARIKKVENFWAGGSFDENSNVQFGEGGAGTFSDGKLTTRISDSRCGYVMDTFVEFGAPQEIKKAAKPHVGTDKLRDIVRAIRSEIIRCGGEVRFQAKLDCLQIQSGRLCGIRLNDGSEISADTLVLAIGHSARDTFRMLLKKGFVLSPKPFSVGVRIEHLQSDIDRGLYGKLAGHPSLPKGEYQLSLRQSGRAVYTFCMCPGGTVVAAASEQGGVVTNGMSDFQRSGKNANAALVVSVDAKDFGSAPLDGVEFQQKLEHAAYQAGGSSFKAPFQTVASFMDSTAKMGIGHVHPTYENGVVPFMLETVLPAPVTDMLKTGIVAFGRKLPGFSSGDALLTGVETRTSSPIRILRNESLQAVGLKGIYPAGEGAGYAGGIVSAAVDGLRAAEAIVSRYAPF